jgi:hypothetical protein
MITGSSESCRLSASTATSPSNRRGAGGSMFGPPMPGAIGGEFVKRGGNPPSAGLR